MTSHKCTNKDWKSVIGCLVDTTIYCGRDNPCVWSGGVVLLLGLWAGGTKIEVFRFRGEELGLS